MKNIIEICNSLGIEVPEEKKNELTKSVNENYKTIAEFDKKVKKLEDEKGELEATLSNTQEALDGLKELDPEGLAKQIEELKASNKKARAEYEAQIADRDFNDTLKSAIADKKGINAKAIMALLDVDTLKNSHNRDKDIASALDGLMQAEDSKMLFKTEEGAKPKFTTPMNPQGKGETTSLKDLTLDERIKLKATSPDLYESMKKEA